MIPFQKAYCLDKARPLIDRVLASGRTEGDGSMTKRCQDWLSTRLETPGVLMMTSCTHALEEALQMLNLQPDDEVIVPSFAYPSAANAVLLAGARVVFAEVEPVHLTLDPERLQSSLTPRTRAVIAVHYGGISCDMDRILAITQPAGIEIIEDCAQSFLTQYKGRFTGTIGKFGCLSFHGTKDVVAGEGGALIVNDPEHVHSARVFRQKGTNRDEFTEGRAEQYEWLSVGSSYSPGELPMALLASQLELSDQIVARRRRLFRRYADHFELHKNGSGHDAVLESTSTPSAHCDENGHLFYLLFKHESDAANLIRHLRLAGIDARTHFFPMHESRFGKQFIRSANRFETEEAIGRRLVRLPLYADMTDEEQDLVLAAVDDSLREMIRHD